VEQPLTLKTQYRQSVIQKFKSVESAIFGQIFRCCSYSNTIRLQ